MALSARLTVVGSTNGTPLNFTAASPSLDLYQMTSTMINYGPIADLGPNAATASYSGGPVPAGYVNVQYHVNNQWKTAILYTAQTGAQINTLVTA